MVSTNQIIHSRPQSHVPTIKYACNVSTRNLNAVRYCFCVLYSKCTVHTLTVFLAGSAIIFIRHFFSASRFWNTHILQILQFLQIWGFLSTLVRLEFLKCTTFVTNLQMRKQSKTWNVLHSRNRLLLYYYYCPCWFWVSALKEIGFVSTIQIDFHYTTWAWAALTLCTLRNKESFAAFCCMY